MTFNPDIYPPGRDPLNHLVLAYERLRKIQGKSVSRALIDREIIEAAMLCLAELRGRGDATLQRFYDMDSKISSYDRVASDLELRLKQLRNQAAAYEELKDSTNKKLHDQDRKLDEMSEKLHTLEQGVAELLRDRE